jgi:hypothetical protein
MKEQKYLQSKTMSQREKNGAAKLNVLTSWSTVANPKCGPNYSVFITKLYFFVNFTYPLRCFLVRLVENHWSRSHCKSLDVAQPYEPPRSVTGIDSPLPSTHFIQPTV